MISLCPYLNPGAFHYIFSPRSAEEGKEREALVGTWCAARVNPLHLSRKEVAASLRKANVIKPQACLNPHEMSTLSITSVG